MRKRKNLLSLFMILTLVMTMVGAAVSVSYAAEPGVLDYCGPMWIWPDSGGVAWVRTDQAVNSVYLQVEDGALWDTVAPCNSLDESNRYWMCSIITEPEDNGEYWYYRFAIEYGGGTVYSPEFRVECSDYLDAERVYGDNRYETVLAVADIIGAWPAVVIACGTDFADALGGAYLANLYEAPILLVNNDPNRISATASEIADRMDSGGRVFILGGEGAVSGEVETALKAKGIPDDKITRFAGKNRYDTNMLILKYCMIDVQELMVCSGTDYADALSASAIGNPVFLVGKELTDEQKEYLLTLSPYYVNLVGGEGAVSGKIEQWLDDNYFHIYRYAGKNRYETSYMLAYDYYIRQSYYIVLAYGLDFPDGLAGGPLAYMLRAPILLVNDYNYLDAERFALKNGCRFGVALGGPALISDETVIRIMTHSDLLDGGHAGAPEAAPSWSKYH